MRFVVVLVLTLIVAFSDASAQQSGAPGSGERLALLIGNARYPDSDTPLKEPINDVRALAAELRRDVNGFEVEIAENLSKEAMHRAFERFYGKIKSGSVALVFFSGFAIQSNRQSYLIPVDGQVWTEADVRRDGISLDVILKEMNSRGASIKIAILDASRRNPFERRFRPVAAGLAPVITPTGALVMYSAAPSAVVSDSGTETPSFVSELIKAISVQDSTGEEVFQRTRMGVTRASQGRQVPWFSSSLITEFSFSRRASKPSVAALPTPDPKPAPPPRTEPLAEPRPVARPPEPTIRPPEPAIRPPEPSLPPVAKKPEDPVMQDLNRRLQANPNDIAALYRRGQIHARNEDFNNAIRDFDETIRLNPKDPEALNNRCWVRAVIGELQGALRDCNEALQLRPRYADALDSRGFVKLKSGMPQNAITDYDAALQINVKNASSLYGRGIAKLRSGNTAGGNSDIAAAKALNPRIADEFAAYGVR